LESTLLMRGFYPQTGCSDSEPACDMPLDIKRCHEPRSACVTGFPPRFQAS